jgi:hypothetical protein
VSPSAADAIFWVAVVCCAVAELFILRSTFAPRERRRPSGDDPPGPRSAEPLPLLRRAAELAWALIPAVALALVLAATWRAMHPAPTSIRGPLPAERLTAREMSQAARGGAPI